MPNKEFWKSGLQRDAEARKFKKPAIGAMPKQEN